MFWGNYLGAAQWRTLAGFAQPLSLCADVLAQAPGLDRVGRLGDSLGFSSLVKPNAQATFSISNQLFCLVLFHPRQVEYSQLAMIAIATTVVAFHFFPTLGTGG